MSENKLKVIIETYGCQMNVSDSELIQGILAQGGMEAASTLDDADVIIINTCAIREKAEARIFGRLTNLLPYKRKKPHLLIGVVGCMAQHLGDTITKRAPYVDFVLGPDNYRSLPHVIAEKAKHFIGTSFYRHELYDGLVPRRPKGVTAWLTIQRGCNYACTYCIVPYVRGGERNIPAEQLITEAKALVQQGFSVITLLGQTVNSYEDGDWDFLKLLKAIVAIDGIEQVRFTSPHPLGFSDELIEFIATEPKMAKFVHLPMQSASNTMLERMKRGYTFEAFEAIVTKLRELNPDIAVSTDIIVGFSGESDEDYLKTKEALERLRFDFAFLFAYSERSLSVASRRLEDDVAPEVKQKRLAEIIAIQQEISRERYQEWVGRRVEVMLEGYSQRDEKMAIGNTKGFKTVVFPREDYKAGDWVEVEITAATSLTLSGHAISLIKANPRHIQPEDPITLGLSIGPVPKEEAAPEESL